MVVHMRRNRSQTGMRRSHHRLDEPRLSKCECGGWHLRHRACQACGKYRGHQVVDVVTRTERAQKRSKRKEEALMASGKITSADAQKQSDDAKEAAQIEEKPKEETGDKRVRAKQSKGK